MASSTTLLEAKNTLGDPLVLDSTPKDDHLEDQFNRDSGNESGGQDKLKPKLFTTRELSPRGHVTNSDPEISEPKEHSFSFQSVDPHRSTHAPWHRSTFTKAKNLFGKFQRSLSHMSAKDYVHSPVGRHTYDGASLDPLVGEEDPFKSRNRGGSNDTSRTSRTGSDRSARMVSFRSQDGSVVIHDDHPPDILETSREYDDDSFVAIPHITTNHSGSDSGGFGEIGNSYDQITSEATRVVKALNICQRFALKPNSIILKMIGWRRFKKSGSDLHQPIYIRACNTLYPLFIFFLLLIALSIQTVLCFSRTDSVPGSNNVTIMCGDGLITRNIIPNVIIMASYILGLYVFRFELPDHYYAVMETVFLSFTWTSGNTKFIRRVVVVIVGFLFVGLLLLLMAIALNIWRVIALDPPNRNITFVLSESVDINFSQLNEVGLIILAIIAFVGVTIFDIFYIVVIVTYVSQCQLLIYYIDNICERVKSSSVPFDVAIKDIHNLRDFVKTLNGNISHIVSLLLFNFVSFSLSVFSELYKLPAELSGLDGEAYYPYILGTLNLFQWVVFLVIPIIQATRLTHAGKKIRRLGLELRARPYIYAETPQLDLDSFQMYCANVRIQANFAYVPMYPCLVVGMLFVGCIGVITLLKVSDGFDWAPWL